MKNYNFLIIPILILTLAFTPAPYSRDQYKHWIDEDGDCQNTRAEVLIRDSLGPVTFRDNGNCTVESGTWVDPYTGKLFTKASDLDIDHVVPLKNAHTSGANSWNRAKKTAYANDLTHSKHLLAVSLSENRKKGADGPDHYLPPNEAYLCEYVVIWSEIKKAWHLRMNRDENKVINLIKKSHC